MSKNFSSLSFIFFSSTSSFFMINAKLCVQFGGLNSKCYFLLLLLLFFMKSLYTFKYGNYKKNLSSQNRLLNINIRKISQKSKFKLNLELLFVFLTDMDVFKVSKSYCLRTAIQIYCYQLAHRLYKLKITMIQATITRSLCTILIIMLVCVRQQQIHRIAPSVAVCVQQLHLWILNQRRKHILPSINSMIGYWPLNIMSHRQYHRLRVKIHHHQYLV